MSYIAEKLRDHDAALVRLNRQDQMKRLGGKVVERDPAKRTVRLELGTDPETGNKVLSPPVRVQSMSAGAFKGFVLPSIGEQMYLESAGGTVGADSIATFGAFDDEHKHPTQDPDELVFENGDSRFSIKAGEIKVKSGGTTLTLSPGGLASSASAYDWNQS